MCTQSTAKRRRRQFAAESANENAPDSDGWIQWNGGECPVPAGSRCSIKLRYAGFGTVYDPEVWRWDRLEDCPDNTGDIIAYRPEPEQESQQPIADTGSAGATHLNYTGATTETTNVSDADVYADSPARHTDRPATPEPETPLDCAIERITRPVLAQADELEAEALELRHAVAEAVRLAKEAQSRTPGLTEAHNALKLAVQIIEECRNDRANPLP